MPIKGILEICKTEILKKICTKCNIEKYITEFHKCNKNKDGCNYDCKVCRKKYQSDRKKMKSLNDKKRYQENKEEIKEKVKFYYDKNKEEIKEYQKNYYLENIDKIKKYRKINKDRIKKYKRDFSNYKYNNDPIFKLSCNLRGIIYHSLNNNGYSKKSKTYEIVGCSFEYLLIHLNNNPYGFKHEDGLYDIDHITPLSEAKTEQEIIELNHYTNLQLLPSKYNRNVKMDKKWNKTEFELWLESNYK